jgi:predicted permease
MSPARFLDDMMRDVRYGARVLVRNPLFSAVAIASLSLGIGGAASVFTVLNAVILRTLPVPNPQQLFIAEKITAVDRHGRYSWPAAEQARKDLAGRAELAVFTSPTGMQVRPTEQSNAPADRAMVQLVSGEFFTVLRQQPQAGRLLQPSDNVTLGGHPVAVISDGFWEQQYQRSPAAVGRTLILNGQRFTIVGVAAREFFGPIVAISNPDLWIPLVMQHEARYAANASNSDPADPRKPWPPQDLIEWLSAIVRVPAAADIPQATERLTLQYRRELLARLDPSDDEGRRAAERQSVVLTDGAHGVSFLREELTRPLYVLLGMVAVLLVIACGNLASLLISRANARDREMAIRLSIGAGRGRVIRQLLAETLLLAFIGGGLGLLLAAWGKDALLMMFASSATAVDLDTRFDWRVLAFALAVTVITGILAGVGPALRGTRVSLAESMKHQSRAVGVGVRGALVGKSLVGAQIAFCLLLLVLAALFTRSMDSLLQVDVGYDRDRLLVARLDVRSLGYSDEHRQALYERLLQRITRIPGVESASLSLNGPLGTGRRMSSMTVEGYTPAPQERMITNEEAVTVDYFRTVGLRIVQGRDFVPADRAAAAPQTIVNETMAKRYFPDGDALGRRWSYGDTIEKDSPVIVGIVENARYIDVRGEVPNMIYQLSAATPDVVLSNVEVRAAVPPAQLGGALRRALSEAEPGLPVFDIIPLIERVNRGISNDRLVARLTTAFSVVALLLACLGLYGTISYGVTQRVTELGVRMALGAARRDVLWLVIREAAIVVAIGMAVGVLLSVPAGRSVGTLLHGVAPIDPLSYVIAATALTAVAGLAAFLPAHRASRIDPMVALRTQ